MIGIGVIGYGYWGPNFVRNISELADARVVIVADLKGERLALAKRRNPVIETTRDPLDVINHPQVDAVIVATPVATHFDLALQAVRAGKHTLVEKPVCATRSQAERLIEAADSRNVTLMVDHTFLYTGAVRKVKELVGSGQIGDVYYYDAVRINLGLFQSDTNVLWDLAVHDLSIIDFVLGVQPTALSCSGVSHVPGQREDVAFLTLHFPANLIAHLHVNWLSPVKLRRTLIGGSRRMIVYDDLEPHEKVRVHDKGVIVDDQEKRYQLRLVGYRTGDVWSPQVDLSEALRTELIHFTHCIEGREQPITDGRSGLRVVRLLEAASQSLANKGIPIELGAAAV